MYFSLSGTEPKGFYISCVDWKTQYLMKIRMIKQIAVYATNKTSWNMDLNFDKSLYWGAKGNMVPINTDFNGKILIATNTGLTFGLSGIIDWRYNFKE